MENIKGRRQKMGKESSLARPKSDNRPSRPRGRPSVLLVGSRPRLPVYSSAGRNQRKETTTINKKGKGNKTEATQAACSASATAEVLYARGSIRPKRGRPTGSNKNRQPNNGPKGPDSGSRRSAKELGIEWIGDFCPDGQPHTLIDSHHLYQGSIFRCTNCHQQIWLPTEYSDARELDRLIDFMGVQKGYCKYLDSHRPAKIMVAKLQALWRAKQRSNNGEFMLKVLEIMGDKEYDRVL